MYIYELTMDTSDSSSLVTNSNQRPVYHGQVLPNQPQVQQIGQAICSEVQ